MESGAASLLFRGDFLLIYFMAFDLRMVEEPYASVWEDLSQLASVLCISFHVSVDQRSPSLCRWANCSASVMFRDHNEFSSKLFDLTKQARDYLLKECLPKGIALWLYTTASLSLLKSGTKLRMSAIYHSQGILQSEAPIYSLRLIAGESQASTR